MKTIVTGASGLLGREIYRIFSESGHETIGAAFSRTSGSLQKLDLNDKEATSLFVEKHQPNVVIHAAAERRPDVCTDNPDMAIKLNVEATKHLAELSQIHNFQLIYISSDYVFDGTSAPYSTDGQTNPINFYGKTKLAGEKAVLQFPQNISLRVPVLYGPCQTLAEASITKIADDLLTGKYEQDNWAIRYPTLTTDIAKVLLELTEHSQNEHELSGIFHWSANEPFTKYQIARVMADVLKIKHDLITPIDKPLGDTPRPYDCHLDCSNIEELGICHRSDFKTSINEIINSFGS